MAQKEQKKTNKNTKTKKGPVVTSKEAIPEQTNAVTRNDVAERLNVPAEILLAIEGRFPCVGADESDDGTFYYAAEKLSLLANIVDMHYRQGFTFKGIQNFLDSHGIDCSVEEKETHPSHHHVSSHHVEGQGELPIAPKEEYIVQMDKIERQMESVLEQALNL